MENENVISGGQSGFILSTIYSITANSGCGGGMGGGVVRILFSRMVSVMIKNRDMGMFFSLYQLIIMLFRNLAGFYFHETSFACKRNEPERKPIVKLILSNGKVLRVIFPLFWFTKFVLASI